MVRPKTSVIKIEISWETDAKVKSKIPFEGFGDNLNSVMAFSSMEFELQTAGDVYILLMLQAASSESDVTNIFRVNREIFDTMKDLDADQYQALVNEFKIRKDKFKE